MLQSKVLYYQKLQRTTRSIRNIRLLHHCSMGTVPADTAWHDLHWKRNFSHSFFLTKHYRYKIKDECFLISIHVNASTNDGSWGKAKGWSIFTSKGKTKSDDYATIIFNEAKAELGNECKMRTDMSDGDVDWEENFYILKNSACPAVLSENLFMDNKDECMFLLTDEAVERIALLHFRAIQKIVKK